MNFLKILKQAAIWWGTPFRGTARRVLFYTKSTGRKSFTYRYSHTDHEKDVEVNKIQPAEKTRERTSFQ